MYMYMYMYIYVFTIIIVIIIITFIIQICLIPASAHGTNPASAIMAGLKVVEIPMNKEGEVTKDSFKQKVREREGEGERGRERKERRNRLRIII